MNTKTSKQEKISQLRLTIASGFDAVEESYNELYALGQRPEHYLPPSKEGSKATKASYQRVLTEALDRRDLGDDTKHAMLIGQHGYNKAKFRADLELTKKELDAMRFSWKVKDRRGNLVDKTGDYTEYAAFINGIQRGYIKLFKEGLARRAPAGKKDKTPKPVKPTNYLTLYKAFFDACSDINDPTVDVKQICDLLGLVESLLPKTNIIESDK
jgi:hypothetical protein